MKIELAAIYFSMLILLPRLRYPSRLLLQANLSNE